MKKQRNIWQQELSTESFSALTLVQIHLSFAILYLKETWKRSGGLSCLLTCPHAFRDRTKFLFAYHM